MVNIVREGKSKGGFLSGIKPLSKPEGGMTWQIYGRSGTGKTRIMSTFPKPLLLIMGQDGTRSIYNVPGIDKTPKLTDSNQIEEVVKMVRKKPSKYKTVALDCADDLNTLVLREVIGEDVPIQLAFGDVSRDDYANRASQIKERLDSLIKLSELGINVVLLVQEAAEEEESQGNALIMPTVGGNMSKSVIKWMNAQVDYIGHAFIRKHKIKKGDKSILVDQWCLRIGPDPVYTTKFRAIDGVKIPQLIVDPNFEKIESIANGTWKDESEEKGKKPKRRK